MAVLAVLWISVFVSAMLRARAAGPLSTSERFRKRLQLLAPPDARGGRWVVVLDSPERRARPALACAQKRFRSARRKRRLLLLLIVAAAGSGVWAFVEGGVALQAHLGIDALLLAYVTLLLELKSRRSASPLGRIHDRARRDIELFEPVAVGERRF